MAYRIISRRRKRKRKIPIEFPSWKTPTNIFDIFNHSLAHSIRSNVLHSSHTISRSFVSFDFERNSVHLFSNSWRTEMISGRRKEESGEERSVSRLGGEGGGKVDRGLSHYARRRPQGLMRERLASARERKPTGWFNVYTKGQSSIYATCLPYYTPLFPYSPSPSSLLLLLRSLSLPSYFSTSFST